MYLNPLEAWGRVRRKAMADSVRNPTDAVS